MRFGVFGILDFGFFGVGSKGLEMRKMMQGASQKTILGNREVRRHQNVQWQIGFSKSINQNIEQQMYVPLSLHLHLSCQAHPLLPPQTPSLNKTGLQTRSSWTISGVAVRMQPGCCVCRWGRRHQCCRGTAETPCTHKAPALSKSTSRASPSKQRIGPGYT